MRSSASTRDRRGACKSRATVKPKPPCPVGPIPTRAAMVESEASSFRPWATDNSADWKQAAYPTANSCSGLVGLTLLSTSTLVDGLTRRGLVVRLAAPHDRRRLPLRLTRARKGALPTAVAAAQKIGRASCRERV